MSERERLGGADTMAASHSSTASDSTSARFDRPAQVIADRYEVLGLLGSGGMGAVYRVRDLVLDEVVALKIIRPDWSKHPEALERFRSEVRLARRVTHRNVARTFDIGESAGEKFLTMECIDGGSLAARISEVGALPAAETIAIVHAICSGLSAAHQAGIVHRDLKPENVLLARDGRVVVTDFGIAHANDARPETVAGTPAYMAPEQLTPGVEIDQRTDVYALGAVIFEMLTGERAWTAARPRSAQPPDARSVRPDASDALAEIALRCMAPAAADRFASADAVAQVLSEIAPEPVKWRAPRMPAPIRTGTTIAVLPFVNEGLAADDFIAEGLTSDFIDTLSMTRGLLVRPRGVVARWKGVQAPIAEIGRELGVDVIVEGSVRRLGESFRIGVRLIATADAFQLWAQRFDTKLEQLLVTSDTAAREIAKALTTTVPAATGARSGDPAAIELYLRATQEFWRSWSSTAKTAVEQFEQALQLSPSDPRILAGTVQALARMMFFGEGDRAAIVARARVLTERAVVLAPEVGDTWSALASYRMNTGDLIGAARALRSGLQHAPNSAALQDFVGRLLAESGPVEEAIARLEIALELNPQLLSARIELSRLLALLGDVQRAEAMLAATESATTDRGTVHASQARLALWRGERPTMETRPDTYARLYVELDPARGLTPAQRTFVTDRASAATGRIRTLFYQRNAEVFAAVGEIDEVITAMQAAVDAHLIDLTWLDRCPLFEDVRADPRFSAIRAVVAERARQIAAALRGET